MSSMDVLLLLYEVLSLVQLTARSPLSFLFFNWKYRLSLRPFLSKDFLS